MFILLYKDTIDNLRPLKIGSFEECLFYICFELQFGYSQSTAKYGFDQGCEMDFAVNVNDVVVNVAYISIMLNSKSFTVRS